MNRIDADQRDEEAGFDGHSWLKTQSPNSHPFLHLRASHSSVVEFSNGDALCVLRALLIDD